MPDQKLPPSPRQDRGLTLPAIGLTGGYPPPPTTPSEFQKGSGTRWQGCPQLKDIDKNIASRRTSYVGHKKIFMFLTPASDLRQVTDFVTISSPIPEVRRVKCLFLTYTPSICCACHRHVSSNLTSEQICVI